jgi:hypothetical protein
MKTETVKLSQVTLNAANPRQIKEEKFTKLVNSILVFPKMLGIRPIVVDDAFVALGGNMRHRALSLIAGMSEADVRKRLSEIKHFGKKTAAEQEALIGYWRQWLAKPTATVIRASELSEEERREFVIKDNVGYGEWDNDALANEWDSEALNEWDVDVDDFFSATGDGRKKDGKAVICPHCGKDISKSYEE